MLPKLRQELPLMAAALLIAFVVWLIAAEGGRESSWVNVPIRLDQVPDNIDAQTTGGRGSEGVSVAVHVQFPKEQRSRIVERNFSVVIHVSEVVSSDPAKWPQPSQKKIVHYNLSVANAEIHGLPQDVHVIEISPDAVDLSVGLRVLALNVRVPTTGALPAQLQLTDNRLVPQPETVLVTGPQATLDRLDDQGQTAQTQPIDLSTVTQSAQLTRDLALPKNAGVQLVNPSDAHVSVSLGVQEKPVVQAFPNVPIGLTVISPSLRAVITPSTAAVTVEGPPSALSQVTPDSFVFSTGNKTLVEKAGKRQQAGLEASFRSRLPQDVARRLRITKVDPSLISVEFVPVNAETIGPGASASTP